MSEWSYYDKSDLISNVKSIKRTTESTEEDVRRLQRQVEGMKGDLSGQVDSIERTAESTENDVRRLRRQIEEMTRNQEEILKAFRAMAQEVAAMREEMYPSVKSTKPAFKASRNDVKNG
ncbi:MAG TPA: hypothetical protein VHP34_05820 [Alphaproteobacteria bacterium]|nr:hypothetical protein [Alphaproteobacteria bacterium]